MKKAIPAQLAGVHASVKTFADEGLGGLGGAGIPQPHPPVQANDPLI